MPKQKRKIWTLVLLITIIFSCTYYYDHKPVVVKKTMSDIPSICDYYYNGFKYEWIMFQDSCSKYNIGDTIK